MKRTKDLLLLLLVVPVFISAVLPDRKIRLYMMGDSTMANKVAAVYPETGWGQVLQQYFDDRVTVDNRAQNGKSTKSFIAEHRWQRILDSLKAGDYVIIEFGHNDEKVDKPGVGATLDEYRANLIMFVDSIRARCAFPLLLTPIMRRSFANGVFHDTHGKYPDVVREVAKTYHVPLIDMHRKSEKLLISLGDEASKTLFNWADSGVYTGFPAGVKDNTHLNPKGANAMAGLAVEGIRELDLPLAKYLK